MLNDDDFAELRRRNLADNEEILKLIKADMQQLMPKLHVPPKTSQKKAKPKKQNVRRFSPPRTRMRTRRGSFSSEASSSSTVSSPDRMVVKFGFFACQNSTTDSWDDDLEEELPRPSKKRRIPRDIRAADEITEEDIDRVAINVRDKNYDSIDGSSCHQCRQKTDDLKTICRSEECVGIRGQFCGPCLRNRYGEDAKVALKDPDWICPPCRGICNCSFCRNRQGKTCTGILIHLAKEKGYTNVNDYLQSLRQMPS